ncbi:hypothetical protein [Halorubrum sp. GN12_10-3_MGM]|uniref:hypothetical protein n=1 Tax=Halorubrum sp. GN12_10-3_MGM TaxID=2518113 RepID=UPI0010F7A927|nr:hypothetical protein [Halorubrum sp. GN12_10-3_MGM]TKX66220.1 hypothetical protein EXE47_03090 [Halorubrum sp. GN12_10-3_MGM]
MSISGIGKADDLEKYWSPALSEKADRLEIKSANRGHTSPIVEEYPYAQQITLSGKFVYHQKGRRGFSPTANGTYEYRAASGLFLIEIEQSNMEADKVFSEINSVVSESAQVRPIKAIDRRYLWSFFEQADQVISTKVRGPDGEKSLRNEIKTAGKKTGETGEIGTYEFSNNLEDYLLLSAKAKFTSPESDEPLVVKYHKGRFEIPSTPSDGAEYIIQLLEREIIAHSEN